jgi:predicted O-methyltransferase YrrM
MVSTFQPKTTLEFGTSLGISTIYLATANNSSTVHTMEGNPDSRQIALNIFKKLNIENIESHVGEFDSILEKVLHKLDSIDLVYLDGNHQKEATLQYFNQLLPKLSSDSIVVLDDIYWSKGMTQAWEALKNHKAVTLSIDLFDVGILFFNTNLSKEHLALIDYWKKPWKLGIFG